VPVKCDRIGNINLDVLRRGTPHAHCVLRTLYRDSIVAREYRLSLPVGRKFRGHPNFLPQCDRPTFTPIQNNRENYISVYLSIYKAHTENNETLEEQT